MVRHRHRRHAQKLGTLGRFRRPDHPVQQRILSVKMQMNKRISHREIK